MGQRTDSFDLGSLMLSSGEARRTQLEVGVDPLEFGGQRYVPREQQVAVTLDAARTSSGYSLRLRCEVELSGPCMRCLADAGTRVALDDREVDQRRDDLASPYVEDDELDLRAWTRDALALALPVQILCREDCLGLCAVCGEDLNTAAPGHAHESAPDSRWAKLRELHLE